MSDTPDVTATPPLAGIRVLDLSQMWAAPGAGMYLADQGADVIKVEPPQGDQARSMFTLPAVNGESRAFWVVNRNKRGMVIDLRQEAGRKLLLRLCRGADVLIHNFRPGVDERLGIGAAAVQADNPRLVYAALSPWGQAGPYRRARGYDLLMQAASGMMGRRSLPNGQPRSTGTWAVDTCTSVLMAYAILLALFQRERTGRGQRVDAALINTAVALQMVELVKPQGESNAWDGPDLGTQAVYSAYRCADGRFIQLAVSTDAEFANLCAALELDAAADARFSTAAARAKHSEALAALLAEVFTRYPGAHWAPRLLEHDVPAQTVLRPDEVFAAEQMRANEVFGQLDQPGAGPTLMMNPPFRLSGYAPTSLRPAPRLGEHTDAVLLEHGLSLAEIAALRRENAVA
jgi:crotonobetainyl-CoA:carnitine CoA-transferase CaiB-like acyl-CoA transferase